MNFSGSALHYLRGNNVSDTKRVLTLWNGKCIQRLCFSLCADGFRWRPVVTATAKRITDREVILDCEVGMQFIRSSTVRSSPAVISGILNCVCPECGGRMGERGKEFRCQGECLTDWRQTWEQASAEIGSRSKSPARRI